MFPVGRWQPGHSWHRDPWAPVLYRELDDPTVTTYPFRVRNDTPYVVQFFLAYSSWTCANDYWTMQPWATRSFRNYNCNLATVHARIDPARILTPSYRLYVTNCLFTIYERSAGVFDIAWSYT
jgi:hypothetical protein